MGVDARTGQVVSTYPARGTEAGASVTSTNVEATADAVWITNSADGSVWRYDLR